VAAQGLGRLHRSAADDPRAARLPDAGPGRYLASLRAGREGVRRNLGNRALTDADREILNGLLEQLDAVESRWPAIEQACQGLPVTLVHGDFRPKNVRIRDAHAGTALYVLDWEMAGWGIPAADLASAIGPAMTVAIDPETYLNVMRERWPDLDDRALQRLAILGRIFQALASADWGSSSLIFESVRHLLRPVGAMRHYRAHLVEGLRAGAEHLGWS
jgi:thiamine kinase-like enzyme